MATPVNTESVDLSKYATQDEIDAFHNGTEDKPETSVDTRSPGADTVEDALKGSKTLLLDAVELTARPWDNSNWVPYTKHEYWPGGDHGIRQETRGVVIHVNDGNYQGTLDYFLGGGSGGVGAHFEIGGLNEGPPVQLVPLDRKCWHAVEANAFAIGVEHAGFGRSRDEWLNQHHEMLHLSANRVAWILHRFNLGRPRLEHNIWRHSDGGVSWGNHDCPGGEFPWDTYLGFVMHAYMTHWAR